METQEEQPQPGWSRLYEPWDSELLSFLIFSSETSALNTVVLPKSGQNSSNQV